MVARPTDIPEWASTAGRRLEPAAGEKDDGFNEGTRTPARKANWIVGVVADWVDYIRSIIDSNEEHTYQAAKARWKVIAPWTGVPQPMPDGSAIGWRPASVLDPGVVGYELESQQNGAALFVDVQSLLPDGAVLTRVQAVVDPGAARVGSSRMAMALYEHDIEDASGIVSVDRSEVFLVNDDGTSNRQVLDSGVISQAMSKQVPDQWGTVGYDATVRYLVITAGADAGTNRDRIHAVMLQYDDPGPRNL